MYFPSFPKSLWGALYWLAECNSYTCAWGAARRHLAAELGGIASTRSRAAQDLGKVGRSKFVYKL